MNSEQERRDGVIKCKDMLDFVIGIAVVIVVVAIAILGAVVVRILQ